MDTFNPKVRIIKSSKEFKKEIWQYTPSNCPCRLCKIFIQNIVVFFVCLFVVVFFVFFLYIYDLQFTKENKIYNSQVH